MFERNLIYYNNIRDLKWSTGGFPHYLLNPLPVGSLTQGNAFDARNFQTITLTAVGTGTIIVLGSIQKDPPDFSKPSTITNSYAPIVLADLSIPNTYYAGSVGVTVTGSTAIVEVNSNLITWFAVTRSADTVDVLMTVTDNI